MKKQTYTVWLNKSGKWEFFENIDFDTLILKSGAQIESEAWIESEAHLNGKTDIIVINNQGSRNAPLTAYLKNGVIKIGTGCFLNTVDDFEKKVLKEHGNNEHGKRYRRLLNS